MTLEMSKLWYFDLQNRWKNAGYCTPLDDGHLNIRLILMPVHALFYVGDTPERCMTTPPERAPDYVLRVNFGTTIEQPNWHDLGRGWILGRHIVMVLDFPPPRNEIVAFRSAQQSFDFTN